MKAPMLKNKRKRELPFSIKLKTSIWDNEERLKKKIDSLVMVTALYFIVSTAIFVAQMQWGWVLSQGIFAGLYWLIAMSKWKHDKRKYKEQSRTEGTKKSKQGKES